MYATFVRFYRHNKTKYSNWVFTGFQPDLDSVNEVKEAERDGQLIYFELPKEEEIMEPQYLTELKTNVIKSLMDEFEFTLDEANDAVEESLKKHPSIWNENSDAADLANSLADDEDEE